VKKKRYSEEKIIAIVKQHEAGRCLSMKVRHLGWEFKELLPPFSAD